MPMRMAKIAVSAATYSIDRPFDYLVPEALRDAALPGTCRSARAIGAARGSSSRSRIRASGRTSNA